MNDITTKIGLRGLYKIRKLIDGEVTFETDWFPNLITNAGLDGFATYNPYAGTPYSGYCFVGTGNTTPSIGDTGLTAYLANAALLSSSGNTFVSGTPSYYTSTFTYTFATGTATGTIAEIGIGALFNNVGPVYTLFSHALIVDALGSPTTITVLSNESLEVLYQLQLYNDVTTNTYSVTISGTTYTGSYLLADYGLFLSNSYIVFGGILPFAGFPNFIVYDGSIGTITGSPSGSSSTSNGASMSSYVSGTYTVTYTMVLPVGQGNFGTGISAILFQYAMALYQFSVSPPIPKDSNHILTLQFSISWARYP